MSARSEPPSAAMACTLSPEQLAANRDALLPGLMKRAKERTALDNGYRLRFTPRAGLLDELATIIEQERQCCQFLRFQLIVEPANGPIVLEVTGPQGTRELLDAL